MKQGDALLAILVILFLALVFWVFYTGRFDSLVGSFLDGIWHSIQGMLRSIFHR